MSKARLTTACIHLGLVALLMPWIAIGGLLYFAHLFACAFELDLPGILVAVGGLVVMGLCLLLVCHVVYWLWSAAFKLKHPLASWVDYAAAGLLLLLWPVLLVFLSEPGSAWISVTGYIGYVAAIPVLYSRHFQPT